MNERTSIVVDFEIITPYSLVSVMQNAFKRPSSSATANTVLESVKAAREKLAQMNNGGSSTSSSLNIQAHILYARGVLETGQLEASMDLIKDVSLNLTQAVTDIGQYGRVIAVMAAVIKG